MSKKKKKSETIEVLNFWYPVSMWLRVGDEEENEEFETWVKSHSATGAVLAAMSWLSRFNNVELHVVTVGAGRKKKPK
jgi:hypothetical protein